MAYLRFMKLLVKLYIQSIQVYNYILVINQNLNLLLYRTIGNNCQTNFQIYKFKMLYFRPTCRWDLKIQLIAYNIFYTYDTDIDQWSTGLSSGVYKLIELTWE